MRRSAQKPAQSSLHPLGWGSDPIRLSSCHPKAAPGGVPDPPGPTSRCSAASSRPSRIHPDLPARPSSIHSSSSQATSSPGPLAAVTDGTRTASEAPSAARPSASTAKKR